MGKSFANNIVITSPYNVGSPKPIDDRFVVDTYDNLLDGTLGSSVYEGMLVVTKDTKDLYVLLKYNSRSNPKYTWKKLNADVTESGEVDWDNARVSVLENESDIEGLKFLYNGRMIYIKSTKSLYILVSNKTNPAETVIGEDWIKIGGNTTINIGGDSDNDVNLDVNTSGNLREYVGIGNLIKTGNFYTSEGMNSYDGNGGDSDVEYEYIDLYPTSESNSYIRFYTTGDNWISFHIGDSSLGFQLADIELEDYTHPENDTPIAKGVSINFNNIGEGLDFTNWVEKRPGDVESYVFGETGNGYENLDIYVEKPYVQLAIVVNNVETQIVTENNVDHYIEQNTIIQQLVENIISPEVANEDDIKEMFNS